MNLGDESGLWSSPVWVDFMNLDWNDNLPLDLPGTIRYLERQNIRLEEGVRLVLFQEDGNILGEPDDLISVAHATFDHDEQRWVAKDWEPTVHLSELPEIDQVRYRSMRDEISGPS
jgi:hypothetical protein